MKSNVKTLKLEIVKTPNGAYVHEADTTRFSATDLSKYLFDRKHPESAFVEKWYYVDKRPTKIEKIIPPKKINFRFELIKPEMASDEIPKVIPQEEATVWDYDSYSWEWIEKWKHLSSLYELKWDLTEETYEELDFEIVDSIEMNGVAEHKGFSYPVYKSQWKRNGTKQITEKDTVNCLADRLFFPSLILPDRPVKLSKKQTYDIIRYHVQTHIDPKIVSITSDYDFCFTVTKRIPLSEEEQYQVDVSKLNSKKPKWTTKTRRERKIVAFEMAPKPYQKYTVVEPFEGDNWTDLREKIEKFLTELMIKINKPLKDCPHCNGDGVVED